MTKTWEKAVFWISSLFVVWAALDAFGSLTRFWSFSQHPVHRFTSRRMLEGHLYLVSNIQHRVGHDLQLHDGALFTNFGFGVPLLQMPFHWLAPHLKGPDYLFFPDRPIFVFYLLLTLCFQLFAWRRAFATRFGGTHPRWVAIAPAALTFCAITYGLLPLINFRMIVYEETIAYLFLAQLATLSCYLLYGVSERLKWVLLGGLFAGLGVVIRPTGLFPFLAWIAVFALHRRNWKSGAAFLTTGAPMLALWMFFNWVRTGTLFSHGYENSLPALGYQYPVVRFGSACTRTVQGVVDVASELFWTLFLGVKKLTPILQECNFDIEVPVAFNVPLLGTGVGLAWLALLPIALFRLRKRLEMLAPYFAVAVILAGFTYVGVGFSYRYIGDIQPMMILTVVQLVMTVEFFRRRCVMPAILLVLPLACLVHFFDEIRPMKVSVHPVSGFNWQKVVSDYRELEPKDPKAVLATSVACGTPPTNLWSDRLGWWNDCSVHTFTNLFLGLPKKDSGKYRLSFETEGALPDRLRVYVNGKNFWAHREGSLWSVDLPLHPEKLYAPNLSIAIEWSGKKTMPNPVKLLKIGLG